MYWPTRPCLRRLPLQPALGWPAVCAVIVLSGVSEMAGALGPMVGALRQYDGPLGKSDRALLFGTLGLWLGLAGSLPAAAFWLMPVAILALVVNMINRHSAVACAPSRPHDPNSRYPSLCHA